MINGYMEQAEVKGYADSAKYYEGLKAQSEKSISEMEKERAALVSSLYHLTEVYHGKTKSCKIWLSS